MDLSFDRASKPLCGEFSPAGDKSLAHRAALFAALAEGESEISSFPDSGVTRAMLGALGALGVESSLDGGVLRVKGTGTRRFPREGAVAQCGNSGTTMRLLAGALAMTGSAARLDGSAGLRRRPMSRILEPLAQMGAEASSAGGFAPLDFKARDASKPLAPFDGSIPVASAQVKSCLILAALAASGESVIREPGPSRDHTERMLSAMGADVAAAPDAAPCAVRVKPLSRPLEPLHCRLAGDISSAAFILAAAAIVPGSRVTIRNCGINPGRTGILDCLSAMGADVSISGRTVSAGEPVGDITLRSGALKGMEIGGDLVVRTIDEFPALAVAAAFAEGETAVRGAEELRYKETDRIAAIVRSLRALGAEAEETPDGFRISGGTLKGGTADAGGDHRLAMSMSLAGLRSPERVTVRNAEILSESFPGFESAVKSLAV